MKKLKALLYVYKRSLYNVGYYKDLLKVKLDFSMKYFLMLGLTATVITTTAATIPLVPKIKTSLYTALDEAATMYPEDLVLTAKDGGWMINTAEPFIVPTPKSFEGESDDFPTNLIIFDHQGTINDLKEKDTLILVNEANLLTVNSQGKIEAYPLDTIPDGEFSRATYEEMLSQVREFVKFVPVIVIFFVLLGTIFYYTIFRLIYLLLVALLLLAVGYFMGLRLGFRTYYRLGIHTITLPLTIEVFFSVLGVNMPLMLWFLGIHIAFGIAVIYFLNAKGKPKKKKA